MHVARHLLSQGYGTAQFQLGNRYQGQWVRGKMHGQGTYQWSDGIMCGVCREMMFFERDRVPLDRFLGTSSVTSSSGVAGCSYSGDFHYNKCTGKGKMTWPDGSVSAEPRPATRTTCDDHHAACAALRAPAAALRINPADLLLSLQ